MPVEDRNVKLGTARLRRDARHDDVAVASNTTKPGRCLHPVPLVKGNAIRTRSPGSYVVIDAVAIRVAAEELLGGHAAPILLFGALRQDENHTNRLTGLNLGGKIIRNLEVRFGIQCGLEL